MNKRVRLADEGLTNAHDNSDRLADDEKRWRHRGPSLSSCYEDASDDPNRLLLVDASDSEDDLQMEEGLLAGYVIRRVFINESLI